MQKYLQGELSPDDDVFELLSSYKCYRKPSKGNIEVILKELAHQELIQKPHYITIAWSVQLQFLKGYPEFHGFNSMLVMYPEKKPTLKQIIKLFEVEPKIDE